LGKVLLLAALRRRVNSLANDTPLACLWATPKPCGNMASLRPLALSWMRLSVSLARLSLAVVMALLPPLPTRRPLWAKWTTSPLN
jgi:hypothetical protein